MLFFLESKQALLKLSVPWNTIYSYCYFSIEFAVKETDAGLVCINAKQNNRQNYPVHCFEVPFFRKIWINCQR